MFERTKMCKEYTYALREQKCLKKQKLSKSSHMLYEDKNVHRAHFGIYKKKRQNWWAI